jgi:hypothetical protein
VPIGTPSSRQIRITYQHVGSLPPKSRFRAETQLGEPTLKAIKAFIASKRRPAHDPVSAC